MCASILTCSVGDTFLAVKSLILSKKIKERSYVLLLLLWLLKMSHFTSFFYLSLHVYSDFQCLIFTNFFMFILKSKMVEISLNSSLLKHQILAQSEFFSIPFEINCIIISIDHKVLWFNFYNFEKEETETRELTILIKCNIDFST